MIDTIILAIPKDKALFLDLTQRGVEPWDLQARTKSYEKFVKNPSSHESEILYFPRLTGYKRRNGKFEWESTLKIEFSAPKLLYRNNLDELADSQFGRVVELLKDRLGRMGVVVSVEALKDAAVTAVHYSKNIELKNGYTARYVIGELSKINLNQKFDLTRARYMNDGQSLCAYTAAHSLIIYDKIADLVRDKKRAIDQQQTLYQLNLFESLKAKNPREILRFEVRISQKRKMNALFNKFGFKENPSFKDIFSEKQSRVILFHYWDTMIAGDSALLFAHALAPKDILNQLVLNIKNLSPRKTFYFAGLLWAVQNAGGMRSVRTIVSKQGKDKAWYGIAKDVRQVTALLKNLKTREWYDQIVSALKTHEPFHIQGRENKKTNP